MDTDLASLARDIRRVFPTYNLTPVLKPQLDSIQERYPGVPEHYLAFLWHVGFGSLGDNFMIYSGLVEPDELFDADRAAGLSGLVFLGDNFSGEVIGFDTRHDWQLVSVDTSYSPEPLCEDAQTLGAFIAERLADQEPY